MAISLIIDDRKVEAKEGATILQEAQKLGIEIPTLCYHPALTPMGACRVCIVEVSKGKRTRIVTSCNYPVEEGIEVKTNAERVIRQRRLIMEFLLARCPEVGIVKDMANRLGIKKSRFKEEKSDCILCGLCVRVCEEIMGIGAIDFINRGVDEEVDTPYKIASDVCIGCGACVSVCPTGAIKAEDIKGKRNIERWHASLPMKECKLCGKIVAPEAQIEYLKKKIELPEESFELCTQCRRERYGREIIALGHI